MEKIKVNMSPNPLDVQTIHASQNDGEARQWGFELHNNGELIDTSEVTEQMVFKSYKGGTEQILPENGSTPTTSPFKGDIRYPQGLLTDQEFTYRQSPTESDGLAKITDIKGNTLVWNQIVQNGNFADTSNWSSTRGTISASNNVLTYEVTSVGDSNSANRIIQGINILANHKYLFIGDFMGSKDGIRIIASRNVSSQYFVGSTVLPTANTWYKVSGIGEPTVDGENLCIRYTNVPTIGEVGDKIYMRNIMLFDLTQMGLDITASDFTSLFSLPYYSYNQGSLLSFNGNGIKTVGKNLMLISDDTKINSQKCTVTYQNNGIQVTATGTFARSGYSVRTEIGKTYTISFDGSSTGDFRVIYLGDDLTDWHYTYGFFRLDSTETHYTITITATTNNMLIGFYVTANDSTGVMSIKNFQVEQSNTETSFEPYTTSTTSLPVSTYFPTGMKCAGNVYDELTPRKAITRIGTVDLGSLTWVYSNGRFLTDSVSNKANGITNLKCAIYETSPSGGASGMADKTIKGQSDNARILVHDSAYTDVTTFKNSVQGQYLYYELATPTETPITTASLVTENAEIPLSNNDGVLIGKCTEQLSENPGFIDAKIKLSDADGECYSNKIQLHVERSPQ